MALNFALQYLSSIGGAVFQPWTKTCPPFNNGSFIVHQYQLYPENADWDPNSCLLYFGALFNSTMVIYDPYKAETVEIITFPNITHNPALHVGGVAVDPYTGLVSIVADAAAPFFSDGRDISGDNFIIKWDPRTKEVLWKLNITAVSGGQYSGFQDAATDRRGNTYVVGTFPGTIMRADPAGREVKPWYLPPGGPPYQSTTFSRYGGLAAVGETLIVNDGESGEIYRLDMRAEAGVPLLIPRTPAGSRRMDTDAIYLPPKYDSRVLLAAEDPLGVHVLRSGDGTWKTAEYLGYVSNDVPEARGGWVPATVQVGERIYMLEEYFMDPFVPGGVAGNRTEFPMVDITDEVERLLKG